jgi:hypothetical protein
MESVVKEKRRTLFVCPFLSVKTLEVTGNKNTLNFGGLVPCLGSRCACWTNAESGMCGLASRA